MNEKMPDISGVMDNVMYFLEKDKDGYLVLNKEGRQLLNHFYKPPKQHGKKHLEEWKRLKKSILNP